MSTMFRSFSSFNYRLWFLGALVSNIGGWMQSTAQDWVVLTELTPNDATAMGVTMALQFGPPLVLVSLTGWVADRFDRRRLLMLTQTVLMLLAAAVGILLLAGVMTLPLMLVFALCFGIANAFDSPARQAFVSDVVGRRDASNAVALNSASFNMARLIGPAVAGLLLVVVDSGWVFLVNAATFLAMLLAMLLMHRTELNPRIQRTSTPKLSAGFRYVRSRPDLIVIFIMVFLVGAFGMNFPIFASTMALEFGHEADGYGLLSSILAIGSLAGALLAARRERAKLRVVVIAAGGFGVASLISATMPSFVSYACVLVFVGFGTVTMLTTANGYVQTTTDAALRGRVLALYMAVVMGSTPVGAPIAGAVADAFGPRAAIVLGAVAGILACVVGAGWVLRSGRLHRTDDARFGFALDETRPIDLVTLANPIVESGVEPTQFNDAVAQTAVVRVEAVDCSDPDHPASESDGSDGLPARA